MSRATLRDPQVQEYLERDKGLSLFIASAVRNGVSRFEPVIDPVRREQLNMLDIQNVGEYINKFKIKLTDNLNTFDTILNTKTQDMGKPEFSSGVDKVCNFLADVIDYNKIIQEYLSMSNTPQTRNDIFNKIEPLKKIFAKMLDKIEELTCKFMNVDDADMYKRFFYENIEVRSII